MKNSFLTVGILILVIYIFFPWIISSNITGGDWPYYGTGMFDNFHVFAPLWMAQGNSGLGGVNVDFPLYSYLHFTIGFFVNTLHFPWVIVYKFFWFGLFVLFSMVTSSYLYKCVHKETSLWEQMLAGFLYSSNSYILMIVTGGQMGVALAYSLAPLPLAVLIRFFNSRNVFWKNNLVFGLSLAGVTLFDLRIAYLAILICFFYSIFQYFFANNMSLQKIVGYWFIGLFMLVFLEFYWIIPFAFFKLFYVPPGITSSSGFSFFSFATFSDALALLHPNWPENIFGKVYFLRSEFIIYPVFAFANLLFLDAKKQHKLSVFFFVILSLIGAFMAKGINLPFPQINTWVFNHIPGANLFRDPTKYYTLITISYSMLIPFTIKKVVRSDKSLGIQFFSLIVVLITLLFPLRQAYQYKLTGTFVNNSIPQEYIQLADILKGKKEFFRTLWIPDQSRFRFISDTHPMLVANDFFHTTDTTRITAQLKQPQVIQRLQKESIKYLIIPDDTMHEIFIDNRTYALSLRKKLIAKIDALGFKKFFVGNILMYEIPNIKDHIQLASGQKVKVEMLDSAHYRLSIQTNIPTQLIFVENYQPWWKLIVNNLQIPSKKTVDGFNAFDIPAGIYKAELVFLPEDYQKYFYVISLVGLIVVIALVINRISFRA